MTQQMVVNRYKADLREMFFLLFEQFGLESLLGRPPFEGWGAEEVRSTISGCYRWTREVIGPLNAVGDRQGCRLENGEVKTPAGFKEAWSSLYEAGWKSIGVTPQFGGAGSPRTVQLMIDELLSGANVAFAMYPLLTHAAGELIEAFGTPEQIALYCEPLFGGTWAGTMCLTEPQAGSDVGMVRTRAERNPDGTYRISGTKIFISGGDHDLTENIVHLVLARVDGAPAGTKGLTLFIVPKLRPGGGKNDVSVGAIEHKMGISGSSTCVLNFGENGACIGVPVGGEKKLNQGMSQMFRMMNGARIAVGVQGLAVASTAWLNALEYARDRKQGSSIRNWKDASAARVPIIEHADVRRMLIDMKARVEGIRALAVKLAYHQDRANVLADEDETAAAVHAGQVDLLVPLVKSYATDQGFRICETAIQTFGGAGYTRDYPVEQYCRDAKIFSIYEGTNHIQAMDLVGRKLAQGGGANFAAFTGDVARFVAAHRAHPALGADVERLASAAAMLSDFATKLQGWFADEMAMVPLMANRFLDAMSEVAVAWLLLEGAVIAHRKLEQLPAAHPDATFYAGKVHAASYFARNVLPGVEQKALQMEIADRSALEIPDAGFGGAA
ncbi:MAG TPA: acyl-CoA dehydrogenase [Myxococcales bacterium]|nr:acyl-CoA dehydrogenase [Myxococcales bacterium]